MKSNSYRSHSVAAALAATVVTTVLLATLVESFEPEQLLRFNEDAAASNTVALDRRTDPAVFPQA
jgi:hypothetical protein